MTEKKKSFLSKEVKLKRETFPTKKTMNFVEDSETKTNRYSLIGFGIFIVVLALFTKFCVIDVIYKTNEIQSQYNISNEQIESLNQQLENYNSVEEKYNAMIGTFLTDSEKQCMNRTDLLKMVDEDVLPYVSVTNISITNESISIYTGLTDLNTISKVVDILQKDSRTNYVTVSRTTADSEDSTKVSATLEITCQTEGGNQ